MKIIYTIILSLVVSNSFAQTPDEALRTAWFTQNGSARIIAIGGVMGSLGGDISAAHINPAGIGLYRTKEIVLSLGNLNNVNNFNYRTTSSTNEKPAFEYGTSGIVIGKTNQYTKEKMKSSAFSFSVNQMANYNNRISFKGFNNSSSFSEQYIEELVNDKADTNAAMRNYIFGSTLAYRTFLVDTLNDATGKHIGYKSLVPIATGVNQDYDAVTKGGYHEIAIAFATNLKDKFYFGGSLNIPIVSYKRELNYAETDVSTNPNNQFGFFKYSETLNSSGIGVGFKFGAIYKPAEFWRIGLAIHTPQFISYKDNIRASMTTNTETYAGTHTESSDALNNNNAGERKYTISTPYRIIASGSYVFRETENTKKQRAFLSADIEFVNYRGARFSKTDENGNAVDGYYKTLNGVVKNSYKGNLNFKIGGELKFDPFAFRLGAAYYGSPYADENLKANRLVLSGGVGYRNHGMFIDLSFAHTIMNEVNFPYRLNDVANTFALQTGNLQNVMMTIGFKL